MKRLIAAVIIIAAVAFALPFAALTLERRGYMLEPEHGTLIGEVDGVAIHYHREGQGRRGTFGLEFECVEFVNRWLVAHGHRNLTKSGNAISYYNAAKSKGLTPYANGGEVKPERGDVIVFNVASHNFGHVGIVIGVEQDAVVVAQQNMTFRLWPFVKPVPVEKFALRHENGKWFVDARAPLTCLGWSRAQKKGKES